MASISSRKARKTRRRSTCCMRGPHTRSLTSRQGRRCRCEPVPLWATLSASDEPPMDGCDGGINGWRDG
eukprot:1572865-Rhodomonas_salina.1